MSEALPRRAGTRIRAIDWLRGLAVFDMIMWHAGILLHPSHNHEPTYVWLGFVAGLVAPSFMFAAGFAIALVMARASGDPIARRRRALKSLQRIGEVFVVAFVLKWLLTGGMPWWYVRIDILSCIALSLLLTWPFQYVFASHSYRAAGLALAIAVATFLIAPLIPPGAWGGLIVPGSSDFPPIPWAGYVFLGSAAGALAANGVGQCVFGMSLVVALGALFRFPLGAWNRVYGNAWEIGNIGERCLLFGAIGLLLLGIEEYGRRRQAEIQLLPFRILEIVGTNALTAYVTHIALLFIALPPLFRPTWQFSFFKRWGYKLDWLEYGSALVVLWTLTVFVCWSWPQVLAALASRLPQHRLSSGRG